MPGIYLEGGGEIKKPEYMPGIIHACPILRVSTLICLEFGFKRYRDKNWEGFNTSLS